MGALCRVGIISTVLTRAVVAIRVFATEITELFSARIADIYRIAFVSH